jgi:hypothetical protein
VNILKKIAATDKNKYLSAPMLTAFFNVPPRMASYGYFFNYFQE